MLSRASITLGAARRRAAATRSGDAVVKLDYTNPLTRRVAGAAHLPPREVEER